jgi:hypothetical protein
VQSSIDANPRGIRIERRLVTRTPVLAIRDDEEGVLPDLSREDASRSIATTIGCSRKRNLTRLGRQALRAEGQQTLGPSYGPTAPASIEAASSPAASIASGEYPSAAAASRPWSGGPSS